MVAEERGGNDHNVGSEPFVIEFPQQGLRLPETEAETSSRPQRECSAANVKAAPDLYADRGFDLVGGAGVELHGRVRLA